MKKIYITSLLFNKNGTVLMEEKSSDYNLNMKQEKNYNQSSLFIEV